MRKREGRAGVSKHVIFLFSLEEKAPLLFLSHLLVVLLLSKKDEKGESRQRHLFNLLPLGGGWRRLEEVNMLQRE